MEYIPAYRAPIYEQLATLLAARNIELRICVGTPPPSRATRRDAVLPDNAVFRKSWFASVRGRELTFQQLPRAASSADLVIVQQEAGLVVNYLLVLRSFFGHPFAVWGHGEDPNSTTRSSGIESLKRMVSRRAHWAFAYTDRSRRVFESFGVSPDRITVTNNSTMIDPYYDAGEVDPELLELLAQVKRRTDRIGWFVSSMDSGKRLPVLMGIVERVRNQIGDFEFFFVGDGDARPHVTEFCRARPWAHDLGARRGPDKAAIGEAARLMIMPGAVGLHVLDAFAFGSPLVTAMDPSNSHEVDYLDNDVNGLLLPEGATEDDFSRAVVDILRDESRLGSMCLAAESGAKEFSLEAMTGRFAAGIVQALGMEGLASSGASSLG